MTRCMECERLRKLVSPNTDFEFHDLFVGVEPIEFYTDPANWGMNNKRVSVVVRPSAVFEHAFGRKPTYPDVTKVSNSLQFLGWRRTKRNGFTFFCMPIEQFNQQYRG